MSQTQYSLFGATSVGVGAIVGGGILVLGCLSLTVTGPSALLAFALNGVVAVVTAYTLAQMTKVFPESGGIYVFSKRILSVSAGFSFGWLLWFAHLVTGLLYAVGFSAFLTEAVSGLSLALFAIDTSVLQGSTFQFLFSAIVVGGYSLRLVRGAGGGLFWENLGKLFVLGTLIVVGLIVALLSPQEISREDFSPFFANGLSGLGAAMGLTFIALQGFEVIPSVAGEVKDPKQNVPRAMYFSLAIALAIYLPLLFVVIGLGSTAPVGAWCKEQGDTCFAQAAFNYMGSLGYWLVVVAALFSTLSALSANLLSATKLVQQMARDRTLPRIFSQPYGSSEAPVVAIFTNMGIILAVLGLIRTVETAGAAASLVFLVTYAMSHWLGYVLVRRQMPQGQNEVPNRILGLPQLLGGLSCLCLAAFQAITQPEAGLIAFLWLLIGITIYRTHFHNQALVVDSFDQALRPELMGYRGHTPFVLVPITNPSTAPALVSIAHALAAREAGRVLLFKAVNVPANASDDAIQKELSAASEVLNVALLASLQASPSPAETLLTVSTNPWREIARVAKQHRCRSLVLGVNRLNTTSLESLLRDLRGHVALLSAPDNWNISSAKRILVPVAGGTQHDSLRAQVLGTLVRSGVESIDFVAILSETASSKEEQEAIRTLELRIEDETQGNGSARVLRKQAIVEGIIEEAEDYNLLILGLRRSADGQIDFGTVATEVSRQSACPTLIIGQS